ncbi:MAG TPA: L-histidine N(alpha)-methyltransferase [Micavibrio sp.]
MSFDDFVTEVALDLFSRKQHGHTGEIAYRNGGGKLFGDFTRANPDYYPYHGEIALLKTNALAISHTLKDVEHVIVAGPGPISSFTEKEEPILTLLPNLKAVSFIDISDAFNAAAVNHMKTAPQWAARNIDVESHEVDFHDAAPLIADKGPRAVFATGGLVTTMHNVPLNGFPDQSMQNSLHACRNLAGDDGFVILGYDSNQWHESLSRAYDQSLAPFIKNIMKIIADHTNGIQGFDPHPDNFRYEMQWHRKSHQAALTLIFEKPQVFTIPQNNRPLTFAFDAGDELVMMASLKAPPQKMTQLASYCGLTTLNGYFDQHGLVEHVYKTPPRAQSILPAVINPAAGNKP